jgi:hypothetical protein
LQIDHLTPEIFLIGMISMQPSAWSSFSFSFPKFISSSRPSPHIPKPLMTPNEQLSAVEQHLSEASGIFLDQLSDSISQAGPVDVGEVVKLLITQIGNGMNELAFQGISNGSMAISIFQIVEFEENIRKIIDYFREKKMYPESPEE